MSWETTHEFSTSRLLEVFAFILAVGIVIGAVLTLIAFVTDWYQQLALQIIALHVEHPHVFLVYFFFIAIIYVNHKYKNRKNKKKEGKKQDELNN